MFSSPVLLNRNRRRIGPAVTAPMKWYIRELKAGQYHPCGAGGETNLRYPQTRV
jgi:hypothetical protein